MAIEAALDECGQRDGLLLCPEGAATLAGLRARPERGLDARGRTRRAVQLRRRAQVSAACGERDARSQRSRSILRRCEVKRDASAGYNARPHLVLRRR